MFWPQLQFRLPQSLRPTLRGNSCVFLHDPTHNRADWFVGAYSIPFYPEIVGCIQTILSNFITMLVGWIQMIVGFLSNCRRFSSCIESMVESPVWLEPVHLARFKTGNVVPKHSAWLRIERISALIDCDHPQYICQLVLYRFDTQSHIKPNNWYLNTTSKHIKTYIKTSFQDGLLKLLFCP